MDLQRIRELLSPEQQAAIDLPAAWRHYRSTGGMDDHDLFLSWLVENHSARPDAKSPLKDVPVEVSVVLPSRFTVVHAPRPVSNSGATTLLGGRTLASSDTTNQASASTPAKSADNFHYVLLGTAGKGGMGTVHIAKDTELLRRVALKQLNPEADVVASARTRFLREVQITAQLDHPNIVPVYALELAPDGAPAYTMKLVEGKTFHTVLNEARDFFERDTRPDETRTVLARIEHFLKVCDAIAYAHDKGVIHRDLKPANLMLGRHNEVYVMDWGLCRALRQPEEMATLPDKSLVISSADVSGSASDTQIGDVVGTPKYMSPEQAQGRNRDLDARSDQCALGLILYELVTLNSPYAGKTAYEVLINAAAGKRLPVVHAYLGKRRIPRELVAIIERATALSPTQRYASVGEMAADLRRYLRGEAVQARPDSLWQRVQRIVARNRLTALTGILALVAVGAVTIGGLLWQNQRMFDTQRLREQRLLVLRDSLADVGSDIETRIVQLESGIQNLADSVAQINESGHPGDNRFYLLRDFRDSAKAPPDLIPSKTYGGRISLRWAVWTIPPGMDEADALPTIRKLASLQRFRKDLYHRTATLIKNKEKDMYRMRMEENANAAEGNPLVAIMLAFDNGISSRYPGWDALPLDYDPRKQAWYGIAANQIGPQWGHPYLNPASGLTELPLSVPFYDQDKQFVGVVSALLVPDLMVRNLLDIHDIAGLHGVFLIDANGDILASAGHALPKPDGASENATAQKLPIPQLLERLKSGNAGIFETTLRDLPVVVAVDAVQPMGWHVVAVADPNILFAKAPTPGK